MSRPTRHLDERLLTGVVRYLAVLHLEVERGLRPQEQLGPLLTPAAHRRLRATTRDVIPGGPVRVDDIRNIRIDRTLPDRVAGSVQVRDQDRWSALIVDLRRHRAKWQIERLDRLEHLAAAERRPVAPPDPEERARARPRRARERDLAAAAQQALQRRYAALPDRRSRHAHELRPKLQYWQQQLARLDTEIAELDRSVATVPGLGASRPDPGHGSSTDPVAGVLGPAPHDPARRRAWHDAHEQLDAYRHRWGLPPHEPLLGGDVGPDQHRDRLRLLEAVRDLSAQTPDHRPPAERSPEPLGKVNRQPRGRGSGPSLGL